MVIELCRLVRDVKLSTINFNGEERNVFNNAVAIQVDKAHSTFVNITAWGKTAETMAKHLNKGDELLIRGELRNNKAKLGDKLITTVYVLVTSFAFTYGNRRIDEAQNTNSTANSEL